MLKFHRSVHTRSKKVSVQLLKDFKHVGLRGEVVQVSEGLMRNRLHPGNGAAYMVQGPVIPIVKRQVTIKTPKQVQETKAVPEAKPGILDMLVFDSDEVVESAAPQGDAAAKTTAPDAKNNTKSTEFEWQNEFVKSK